MRKRKGLLCKLGFHSVNKEKIVIGRDWRRYNHIISRHAFCKNCHKKLYRVDKYGCKIKSKEGI